MFLEGVGSDGVGDIKAVPLGVVLVPAVATLLSVYSGKTSQTSHSSSPDRCKRRDGDTSCPFPCSSFRRAIAPTRVLFCHIDLLYHTSVATAEKESGERFKK